MFATLTTAVPDINVIRESVLDALATSDQDDSFIVSREGALATFYKSYEELGVIPTDTNFRWNALDAFLRSEAIHCSEVKVGVCGLIVFACIPGVPSSGSVYWFHEPTRSVLSITFDDCIEGDAFHTGAHFGLHEFMTLYEIHHLARLTGSSAIPTALPRQPYALAA